MFYPVRVFWFIGENMTGRDTDFSGKEQKAIDHLVDVLCNKFEVSADRIKTYMDRDVVGVQSGSEVRRDHIVLDVLMPAVPRNAERLYSMPVQHALADELSKVWKSKNKPLVNVDIHYETPPDADAGQDLGL